jgi:hypothetical protein
MRLRQVAPALAAAALAGCGQQGYGHDVSGFVKQAKTPTRQAVLSSIATYRTTADEKRACSLVTPHFLKLRFDGKEATCEAVARSAQKRELPESATVETITAAAAKVRIKEPTPVRSIYSMRRIAGIWKIDDITEAP